ncbi:NAD(P)/FAD-dependent oxidoreductase [Chloroflexota bacterium]
MFDCDVVVIGGGPAGLTAALYLGRANRKTILLEKELPGGQIKDVEWIENYPGFADGVSGAHLASEMLDQATKYGLRVELVEVAGIEVFSSSRVVTCADGRSYTTAAMIMAGGTQPKKLGVPGEEKLQGRGVFRCALCDGGQFVDQVVAVCGGGDSGITEALYMTKLASKVIVVEAMPALTASAILQERALANPKLKFRCGMKIEAIVGDNQVEAVELRESESDRAETLKVDGVLAHVGVEPNTSYLQDIVPLDSQGHIIVNDRMETAIPYILAAGDIRGGTIGQVVAAASDGATAAVSAQRLLQELG